MSNSLDIAPYPWLVGYCRAPGCGVPMISKPRAATLAPSSYDGWGVHEGHGYCGPHHYRFTRYGDPLAKAPRKPRPPRIETCVKCSAKITGPRRLTEARLVDPAIQPKKGRGMCRACYNAWYKESRDKPDFEPVQRPYEETLAEWVLLRDSGTTEVAVAAERMGMTHRALDAALRRARKRGDIRGSLVPFSHDMRSAA